MTPDSPQHTDRLDPHGTAREPDAPSSEVAKVAELVKDVRVAMLATLESQGPDATDVSVVSHPMATQDVEFDGDLLFIARRDSDTARNIASNPRVNVAYAGSSSWVSVSGTARVLQDPEKLAEQWNAFTDAWLDGGPEDPDNVLVHVAAESAQYWDAPGAKVTQVLNLVKAKVTGNRYEGDGGTVEM